MSWGSTGTWNVMTSWLIVIQINGFDLKKKKKKAKLTENNIKRNLNHFQMIFTNFVRQIKNNKA